MRRTAAALLASLGLHATLFAGALRLPAALAIAPNVSLVPITLEEVKDLPLGRPPPAHGVRARADRERAYMAQRVVRRNPGPSGGGKLAPAHETPAVPPPAAEPAPPPASAEAAGMRPRGDVRAYGPEGSQLVAILRLDRLRAAPDAQAYITSVDEVLRLLPDRQRLLDATELNLYRDFDALLIATPNPFDDTVTFLAARHQLDDAAMRAALDRGAKAAGHTIEWRRERGRYVGVRKSPAGGGAPERDNRLFLLPAPGLLVIASPAYAKVLLDGAAVTESASGTPEAEGRRDRAWSGLVARIDAEDGAIPEDAVFVLTAANLLRSSGGPVVASTSEIDGPLPAMPNVISMIVGTLSTPFLEVRAEFDNEKEARAWEAELPVVKQKLLGNPLVMLAGLNPLLSRTRLQRDERTVVLRTTTATDEIVRLMRMIAGFGGSGGAAGPRP